MSSALQMCRHKVKCSPTNTCEGVIGTGSCCRCSTLTGTFIEHSIVIITACSKPTYVRILHAFIDICEEGTHITIVHVHSSALEIISAPTNTCESAIRTGSYGYCSILTGAFIKCSIIIITAGSKSTDVRILYALIDIWLLKFDGNWVVTNR